MEVEVAIKDDLIDDLMNHRKITKEDAEDLLRVMIMYIKKRCNSLDDYAIDTAVGIFYKDFDKEAFKKMELAVLKKDKLNEKIFINHAIKSKIIRDYNHSDVEKIRENTNNTPLKI